LSQPASPFPLIQAALFDYRGVLAETDAARLQRLAARCGVKERSLRRLLFEGDSYRLALQGEISAEKHWSTAARLLRVPPAELGEFVREICQMDVLDEDLLAFLRVLRPRCKVGLLANAPSDLRLVLADQAGVLETFDDLLISSEVGLVKPDVRIYQLAAQRLGVKPETALMVDASEANILGAQRAGLHTLRYPGSQSGLAALKSLLAA